MTKIKLCGLSRPCDIMTANEWRPEYIGFVFSPSSRRYVTPEQAAELKKNLAPGIQTVGVFVNEDPKTIAILLNSGIISMAQLHGLEDESYIKQLRILTDKPIIKAFRIKDEQDVFAAEISTADDILLDAGAGTGTVFDWRLIRKVQRPYFLAGGLDPMNVKKALDMLKPYAVDVSSGIETDGVKDKTKIAEFVAAVRKEEKT